MQTQVKKLFEGQTLYVGIDCHKKSWKVTILGEHHEHKTMSQDPDPIRLSSYVKRNFPGGSYHAVYEAGFSGFTACRQLQQQGVDCMVTHPADVPTSQKEKLQKTDRSDSRKLARSLRSGELAGVHIPEEALESDRALVRQRFRVVKDISRIKNRIKSLLCQFGIDIPDRFTSAQTRYWSKSYINWLGGLTVEEQSLRKVIDNYISIGELLRKQLLIVNRQIRQLSRTDTYRNNYKLITSIPGIGLMTAMTYLTQLGDIARFKFLDELCNYIGLVPQMYGSGDKLRVGKMMHRGRKELKIMLIESSWVAIRQDPAMMAKFHELIKVMEKNKAIIRIARKLLSRMRCVLTHQQEYVMGVVR